LGLGFSLLSPGFLGRMTAAEPNQTGDSTSPSEKVAVLKKEYEKARSEYFEASAKAKTAEDRQKLRYPDPADYAARFLEAAQKHPKDPAALEALIWIAENARRGPAFEESLSLLIQSHLQSDRLGHVCQTLVYSSSLTAERLLRGVLDKNSNRDVRGQACYSLGRFLLNEADSARYLKEETNPEHRRGLESYYGAEHVKKLEQADPDAMTAEAEKLFERVVSDFGDVKFGERTLAEAARGELFELRNLAIGKVAPEIEGKDVKGRTFKLSEYRGKVVVIDFWGDW
jgi:hypothetical protein